MKDIDFNKIPKIYSDKNTTIYDVRNTEYSMFYNPMVKYVLNEDIVFGKDYPTGALDRDIFYVLRFIDTGMSLDEILDNYHLSNSFNNDMFKNILIQQGFVINPPININKDDVYDLSASELSSLLKKMGITASGKKKKLLNLVLDNISHDNVAKNEFQLTDDGVKFINDFDWINFYDACLDYFEFDDFYKYIDEHDGDYSKLTLNYIDEHIKLAHKKEDFLYLNDCYDSKVMFYLYDEDYQSALKEEFKTFILRLNPIYDYLDIYKEFSVFDLESIENINKCCSEIPTLNVKELFYDVWDEQNLEKEFISKEKGYEFLERLLGNEDCIKVSDEYMNYLKIEN